MLGGLRDIQGEMRSVGSQIYGLDLREELRVRGVHLGIRLWMVTEAVMVAMEEVA